MLESEGHGWDYTWKASTTLCPFSSSVTFTVTKEVSPTPPAASNCCSAANNISGPEKKNLNRMIRSKNQSLNRKPLEDQILPTLFLLEDAQTSTQLFAIPTSWKSSPRLPMPRKCLLNLLLLNSLRKWSNIPLVCQVRGWRTHRCSFEVARISFPLSLYYFLQYDHRDMQC